MYSALKHQGRRLYELARAGENVERPPRKVRILALALEAMDGTSLTMNVHCSKGTYVRTLVEDIALALGTLGHVTVLRRLSVGPYGKCRMFSLAELQSHRDAGGHAALDVLLLPVDSAVADWPVIRLDEDSSFYMRRGQPVQVARAPTEGHVRLYTEAGDFLGIGEVADDGRITPKRLLAAS
jgi:tRNA pseudouridine55 synthase